MIAAVAVLVVLAFGAGLWAKDQARYYPPIVQADCSTMDTGDGTCMANGVAYGIPLGVPWTDKFGSMHDSGTPECLPPLSGVNGLRVAADWVWIDGSAWAQVLWVDCRGH